MGVLEKISFYQHRRDDAPNQELARQLAESRSPADVAEIAAGLWDKNSNVQSDCLKVLYELGYLAPELIAPYGADFIKLLGGKNNRLVWGAMIALACMAPLAGEALYPHLPNILKAFKSGSVITVDAGVKTLAHMAASYPPSRGEVLPFLIEHLRTCRLKEIPQHAESIAVAIGPAERDAFIALLEARMQDMTPAQAARVKRIMKKVA